ncbi:MAG: ABC transporter substrate-binding protein [Candidatus Rokuibacteriota bacterium]
MAFAALGLLASSLGSEAQQAGKVYRIGVLSHETPPPGIVELFRERLRELGYSEGKNVAIELRTADGKNERLATLAEDLIQFNVDVILAVNTPAALAAKKATTKIPIVITRVADPVKSGLVPSLSHPGGNVTGLSFVPDELSGKRLQLLKEVIPGIARVALLWSGDNPGATLIMKTMDAPGAQMGLRLVRVPVLGPSDFQDALRTAVRDGAQALIIVDDALVTRHRAQLVALATQHALPVVSLFPPVAEAGGLMAYGPSTPDMYRRAADFVDRILKGAKPGDLPIEQPTKFHLVVNLGAAKALRLTIPQSLLLRADHVID